MISIFCANSTSINLPISMVWRPRFKIGAPPRQSILSAARVITLSDTPIEETPAFLRHLAYPTYFSNLVEMEAQERALDPLLIYSVIRQESLFQSQVSSWASARGLMQVIPDTGEWIAMRLGWPDFSASHLYLPYVSVKFGVYYLQQQLVTFDGDVVSALTGYNAGPGNAIRLRAAAILDDPDLIYALMDINENAHLSRKGAVQLRDLSPHVLIAASQVFLFRLRRVAPSRHRRLKVKHGGDRPHLLLICT